MKRFNPPPTRGYIIHLAQMSNLTGPFVPRDRPEKKKRYWTARVDVAPEAAASSRVVAKSHSQRFQTYRPTKEQLLPILDDKDSKNPQASKRVGDLNVSS